MAGADPTPKSDFKPAEADCWTVGGGTGAGAVPTPKIDFRPAAAAPVDWTVPLTGGAVGCGGGGTAAAAETPSIALSSAALLRCGVGFRAVLPDVTKPFHRLKPLLPDFRLPLNPIPFSGGPMASFHPACLPRPVDAARFARRPAEPERPWDAALEYGCGALGCDMTGGGGADGVLPVVALATGAPFGTAPPAMVDKILSTAAWPEPFGTSLSTMLLLFSTEVFSKCAQTHNFPRKLEQAPCRDVPPTNSSSITTSTHPVVALCMPITVPSKRRCKQQQLRFSHNQCLPRATNFHRLPRAPKGIPLAHRLTILSPISGASSLL